MRRQLDPRLELLLGTWLGLLAAMIPQAPCRGAEPVPGPGEGRKPAEHPAYFQQWEALKGVTRKTAPRGLRSQWHQADLAARRIEKTTSVKNVVYLGPRKVGGRTRSLLVDQQNPKRWFAAAISGGLWVTEDAGMSWKPVDDGAVSLMASCLTQNPKNPKEIYYGTGEARANSADVLGDGVFKSTDGGVTFRQLAATAGDSRFDSCWWIGHAPNAASTVYVGTEAGLLRTENGGAKWELVLDAPGYDGVTDVELFADGSVLAALSGGGLMRSSDGAAGTFKPGTHTKFPTDFLRIELAGCAAKPKVVYAVFESPQYYGGAIGCFRSNDSGASWDEVANPATGSIYDRYCMTLGVHPTDPDRLVCAGRDIVGSSDGGKSWKGVADPHSDYHCVVNLPNADAFLVGNDGGVYRYSWANPAAAPTDLNAGYHVTQFYAGDVAPAGDVYVGGTQDNGTWRLRGGNESKVGYGDGGFCHVSRQDATVAYCSSQEGSMLRTANFGAASPNWTSINTDPMMNGEKYFFINPFAMNSADGQQLYCRTNQAVWRTVNGGTKWFRLTAGRLSGHYMLECERAADPTLYVSGWGMLLRVDGAGTAPQGKEVDLSPSIPADIRYDSLAAMAIHPKDSGTLFVGASNFSAKPRLWRVEGAKTAAPTWKAVNGDLPQKLPVNAVRVDERDPDQTLFAGTDFGLYVSSDGGKTWKKEQRIPNVAVHGMRYRDGDRTLVLFTHGRGVWKVELQ